MGFDVRRWVVSAIAVGAVLWPLVRQPQSDGFPLSNYPMFTVDRPQETTISLVVGLDENGTEVTLAPRLVGGSIEVIHAARTVERAIEDGSTARLCDEVAARVGRDGPVAATQALVVTDTYDIVAGLVDDAPPLDRTVHARCEVPR